MIQFREKALPLPEDAAPGTLADVVIKPYLMDLESTNKTWLNGKAIEPSRYIEMLEKDVLRFGESTREYVLLSEEAV